MIKQIDILVYGDPRLRQRAEEVADHAECQSLVSHMRTLMTEKHGVGLAATQLGDMRRVIVWRVGEDEGELINPILTLGEDTEVAMEGCLSVPGMAGDVRRAMEITAEGFDENGKAVRLRAQGLLARVIQHEVDHLDGVLFLDRAEPGSLRPTLLTQVPGI